jgi:hypothetical protein
LLLLQVVSIVHKRPADTSAFTATLRSGALYTTYEPTGYYKPTVDAIVQWSHDLKKKLKLDDMPYWWSIDCIESDNLEEMPGIFSAQSVNAKRRLVLSEINCSCLGLVADTSPDGHQKGMRFAELIAKTVLGL